METSSSTPISTKQKRIAQLARKAPELTFTTLAHNIDLVWLYEAYRRTRKDGATGVDGQDAEEYAASLDTNLRSLLVRAKSKTYVAPPVRRVYIPKGDGSKTRPIGITTFEDKILQRAVVMLLEAIYEQDFMDCSYGFRPKRSAHHALDTLRTQIMTMRGGWVLELDIRKFFDTMDHAHLRTFLRKRVRDGVVLRLIGKWLNAGVMESGRLEYPESGSPQGGVISPILANVYLHEVLDCWFEQTVKPRLKGQAKLVRYADDAVMLFSREDDAKKVLNVLPKRFGKYGLSLHPDKTRLIKFQRPALQAKATDTETVRPETFDFLGFTHYWTQNKHQRWVVKRKTAKDRFKRSLTAINQWCRQHRHDKVQEQWRMLTQKVRGHYAYYGITSNSRSICQFRYQAERLWHKWLARRSRSKQYCWERFDFVRKRYPLPPARLIPKASRIT